MKRRVIKQGNNTLTLTLPRKWAEKHNVNAGDELEVEERNDMLTIYSHNEKVPKSAKFHLESDNEIYVYQVLRNLYNNDIENLELTYNNPNVLLCIQHFNRRFLGWEFIEQDERHCKIKNYTTYEEENFKELYKKSFMNIISMSEIILDNLRLGKDLDLRKIQPLNEAAHRFANYCRKMLLKKTMFQIAQTRAHSHLLTTTITISSTIIDMANYISQQKKNKIPTILLNYFRKIIDYYKKIFEIFLQKNIKDIAKVINIGVELKEEGLTLLKKSEREESVILYFLITISVLIRQQCGRIVVSSADI